MNRNGTLTDRQQELFTIICEYWQKHGFAPTIRELIDRTDITSTSVVNYNLNRLECEGLIERRVPGQSRNIRPILEPRAVCSACGRELKLIVGLAGVKIICPEHGVIHQAEAERQVA